MKKMFMYLVLMAICLPSYVQAGIEDLKISIKPVMNEYTGDKVELSVKNTGNKNFRGNITLMVPAQWGAKPAGIVSFNIESGKTIKKIWTFTNALKNPYNKYTVRVKIDSNNSVIEKQILVKGKKSASVCLGKPRSSKNISSSIFGTQTHFGQWWDYKKVLPMIEKTGLKWIRDECSWGSVEKQKGVLKIPDNAKKWINDANVRGINVLMILDYGNKYYPYKDFEAFKKGYVDYCVFMVKKLKGKVKVWELWNEPHNFGIRKAYGGVWNAKPGKGEKVSPWMDKFTDLVIAAAKAIRKTDPDAVIITGGGVPPATHYMLELLKQKKSTKLFDGITLHPYTFKLPPEILPYGGKIITRRDGIRTADDDKSYSSLLRCMREKMSSVGMKNSDIYVTEFGFTSYHRISDGIYMGFSPETQAKYLSRMFMLHLAYGIKIAIQYDFQNDGNSIHHAENNFGMVKRDLTPKPSYFAIQRICSLFSSPVELYKSKLPLAVIPDRYMSSKNWKTYEPLVVWDGSKCQPLGRVEKHIFKNGEKELIIVLWNAIRATGERQPLLTENIIVGTTEYANPLAIDILTGQTYDIKSEIKGKKTFLKGVIIPDYPIVIKMFRK